MNRICLLCRTEFSGDEAVCPNDGANLHEVLADTNFDPETVTNKVLDGRYILEKHIGSGGMGTVFRARHAFLDRVVAVKILHPELLVISDVRARFLREAQSASAIDHERVVDVLDFGVTPTHICFLVMEHLYGRDLAEELTGNARLDVEDVLEIGIQVCEALSAIHGVGFVHRDLKPENIWLGGETPRPYDIKLLDFGVVGMVEGSLSASTRLTQIGRTIGTPQYMSPEQCKGEEVDGRSDLYALGCILWELLAGEAAFQGKAPLDVLTKHLIHTPPPVSTKAPEIPPGLDAVIAHCLEKDRTRRWESADQLAAALRALSASLARGQRIEQATEPENSFAWASTLDALPDTDVEHLIEGRYVVTGDLAERKATRIYRGKRLSDELPIAVKLYGRAHRHAASEDARKRFLSLAGRAARIEHPNLVRVFDYGVIGNGNRPFLIMELLNGTSLGDYLEKNGPLGARRAIPLFEEILAALAVGHREDLVHGDIKPESLVLVDEGTRNERLCALDYLIATPPRDLLAEHRITGSDQLSSGRYLPPEYVNEQEVGPTLDVYQAALVLAECLTGEPLVGGDSVMQCIAKCSVGDLTWDDRLLDSPLGPVLQRALAFDTSARFADAGEFADALSALTPKETNLIEACLSRPRKRRASRNERASKRPAPQPETDGEQAVPNTLDTTDNMVRFRESTTDIERIGSIAGAFVEGEDDTDSESVRSEDEDLFGIEEPTSTEGIGPLATSESVAVGAAAPKDDFSVGDSGTGGASEHAADTAATLATPKIPPPDEAGTRPMSMMEISQLVHPRASDALTVDTSELPAAANKKPVLIMGIAAGLCLAVGLIWYMSQAPTAPAGPAPVRHAIGAKKADTVDGGAGQAAKNTASDAMPTERVNEAAGTATPAASRAARVLNTRKSARKTDGSKSTSGKSKPRRSEKKRKPNFQIR